MEIAMLGLLGVAILISIVSMVCWIIIVIKMFSNDGAGTGIFGVICGLYAFIWGWQRAGDLGHKPVMFIWTGAMVGSFVINALMGVIGQA